MRGTHTRRRRGTVAGLIAVAVAAGVTVAVVVTRDDHEDRATGVATGPADPGRRAWQVTLAVDATSGFVVTAGVTDGARQTLTVQDLSLGGPDGRYGGEVTAFPPGTLDES